MALVWMAPLFLLSDDLNVSQFCVIIIIFIFFTFQSGISYVILKSNLKHKA